MAKPSHKKIRLAINGLGRVGRMFLKLAYNSKQFDLAAISSRSSLDQYANLIKYDSTYGIWDKEVKHSKNQLLINGKKIPFIQDSEGKQPWKKLKIDVVVDATGKYTKKTDAQKHLQNGAKYMVCAAPMEDADETFVLGANEKQFNPEMHKIISAGSCTTVCSALTLKVLNDTFGLKQGFINTVHAFTSDQVLLDNAHKDPRRARGALQSIIPTSSGVSKTITRLYPQLQGKISALAFRVPIASPSVAVITAELNKKTTIEQIKKAYKKAAAGNLKGHLGISELPLVSVDFKGNPNGSTIDLYSSELVSGNLANILAWYDNEWGYVTQTVKLVEYLCSRIAKTAF